MPFERLERTQPQLASRLRGELEKGNLARSSLFFGPPYSSKMTAASELALALLGEEDRFDTLTSANLVIIPNRDSLIRLKALRNILEKNRNLAAAGAFRHENAVFLSAFHEALYTNSQKDVFAAAAELSDVMYSFPSDPSSGQLEPFLKKYDEALARLISRKKKTSVYTIDQVRQIQSFAFQNPDQKKVIVLEGTENVAAGTMNSILKILEEPPASVYFILISSSASRILPTILSRVRQYEFHEIGQKEEKQFLESTFFAHDSLSIQDFFFSAGGLDLAKLSSEAENFVHRLLIRRKPLDAQELTALSFFLEEFSAFDLFIRRVMEIIEDGFRQSVIADRPASDILDLFCRAVTQADIYSQNRRTMLERIQRGISVL